jgi:hypothetical protein
VNGDEKYIIMPKNTGIPIPKKYGNTDSQKYGNTDSIEVYPASGNSLH